MHRKVGVGGKENEGVLVRADTTTSENPGLLGVAGLLALGLRPWRGGVARGKRKGTLGEGTTHKYTLRSLPTSV